MKRNIAFGLTLGLGLAFGLGPSGAAPAAAADAAAGKKVFNSCRACHTVEPEKNKLGPSLAGVVDRQAGTVPGFAYSAAMKDSGITWNAENLDKFLANPRGFMPGNKMAFAGVRKDEDRVNLIAYLQNPD